MERKSSCILRSHLAFLLDKTFIRLIRLLICGCEWTRLHCPLSKKMRNIGNKFFHQYYSAIYLSIVWYGFFYFFLPCKNRQASLVGHVCAVLKRRQFEFFRVYNLIRSYSDSLFKYYYLSKYYGENDLKLRIWIQYSGTSLANLSRDIKFYCSDTQT